MSLADDMIRTMNEKYNGERKMKHIVEENSDPKPVVDINQLIDTVREKKDCHLSIFISNVGTTINVYPNDPDPHWIEVNDGYKCSNCGGFTRMPIYHCGVCGEGLKHPDLMKREEQK